MFHSGKQPKNKFVNVSFPYCEKSVCGEDFIIDDIYAGVHFSLMSQMRGLILYIHGLSEYPKDPWKEVVVPNPEDSVEGQALQRSVDDMEEFVKSNPHWFSQCHEFTEKNYDSGISSLPCVPVDHQRNSDPENQDWDLWREGDQVSDHLSFSQAGIGSDSHGELNRVLEVSVYGDQSSYTDCLQPSAEQLGNERCEPDGSGAFASTEQQLMISPDQITLRTYTESELLDFIDNGSGWNPSVGSPSVPEQGAAPGGLAWLSVQEGGTSVSRAGPGQFECYSDASSDGGYSV